MKYAENLFKKNRNKKYKYLSKRKLFHKSLKQNKKSALTSVPVTIQDINHKHYYNKHIELCHNQTRNFYKCPKIDLFHADGLTQDGNMLKKSHRIVSFSKIQTELMEMVGCLLWMSSIKKRNKHIKWSDKKSWIDLLHIIKQEMQIMSHIEKKTHSKHHTEQVSHKNLYGQMKVLKF